MVKIMLDPKFFLIWFSLSEGYCKNFRCLSDLVANIDTSSINKILQVFLILYTKRI
jgi:hypothetical protein